MQLLAVYKFQKLLRDQLRLRTACDFQAKSVTVTAPESFKLPSIEQLEGALPGAIREAVVVTNDEELATAIAGSAEDSGFSLVRVPYDPQALLALRQRVPSAVVLAPDGGDMETASLLRAELEDAGLKVYVSFPKRVAEGLAHLGRLAKVLGIERDPIAGARAKRVITEGYHLLRAAEAKRATLRPLRAFFPIWADPLMTAPLLQATTEGRSTDAAEDTARRRREQRSAGITNLVPRTVSAHGGALAYIAHEKKPSGVLQLINPFAPASLGTGSASMFEWRPGEGAAPLPRAFRDERTHEPVGITILGTPR